MGTERIDQVFQSRNCAFMPYAVVGYPNPEGFIQRIKVLFDNGADLLELGVPFSDPLADGPTIQTASQQALAQGISLEKCLELVEELRANGISTPALLMTYYNPILAYGIHNCVARCAQAGVDGFIIPDLPPEEAQDMQSACNEHNLAMVFLLSPNSPSERIALVTEKSRGFIYLVSLTGVTGTRQTLPPGLAEFINRVRSVTNKPLALGFGISNGEQAAAVSPLVDGVIVGSALVQRSAGPLTDLADLARELRAGIG